MLLNGQQVGTSETQADGQVTVTGDVPAQLAAGETNLQLRVPLTDTAVAGSKQQPLPRLPKHKPNSHWRQT